MTFKPKDEVKVDSGIYSTLISSLIKSGRSNEVSGILEEMREKGCEPDTVTYNALINGFCVESDFESAYGVLDEMVEKGLIPDVIATNMMLAALFRIQNWKEATYLFGDIHRRGCVPDVLSESGKVEILGKVISSLNNGNAVDADCWSVIVSAYSVQRTCAIRFY